jgi:hypothetical protein
MITYILEPHGRLKGASIRVAIGTEQVLNEITSLCVPSQVGRVSENVKSSLSLNLIVYAVRIEPRKSGCNQVVTT